MGVGLCAFASDKKTLDIQNRGIVETVFLSVIHFFSKNEAEPFEAPNREVIYFFIFIFLFFHYFFIFLFT